MRLLVLLLTPLLGCCAANRPLNHRSGEACSAAVAYVEHVLQRANRDRTATIFSTQDLSVRFVREPFDWYQARGQTAGEAPLGPSKQLVRLLASGGGKSGVLLCPSVAALLKAREVESGPDAVAAAVDDNDRTGADLYRATIEGFSLPAISEDGDEAVLLSSSMAGPLGGSGHIYQLRRDTRRRWIVTGWAALWVS